jgi:hypothetical protein
MFALFISSFFIFDFALGQGTFPKVEPIDVKFKKVDLLSKFAIHVVNPILILFFGLALAYFVFGVLRYIAGGKSEEVRHKGREHILWGLVGMGIMFSAWAILKIVTNTFSIDQDYVTNLENR